jgi:glucose/arabinose dehydrogenase
MKTIIRIVIISLLFHSGYIFGITLPTGFVATQIADELDPVGMYIAPDGRLFFTEKSGKVRIIKNDVLLATPFVDIPNVENFNEQGLFSVILDPDFTANHYVYVMYTLKALSPDPIKNRVVRYTADGDVALAGSEFLLMEWTNPGTIHNGGALAFGNDGKLYVSTGEAGTPSNAQTHANLLGKILRLNKDGTIPADNPFYGTNTGNMRAIYALGFRNPFKMLVQPGTGKIFINDVGAGTWEEINELAAGKNYGWPTIEGKITTQTPPANYQDPLHAYNHSGGSCSIIGGNFYDPSTPLFPAQYVGKYFFADYCGNYIKYLDPTSATPSTTIQTFATDAVRVLDIRVTSDGAMYLIERNGSAGGSTGSNTSSTDGKIWRITYNPNGDPIVSTQPVSITVPISESATFTVTASGDPTLTYQWKRNNVDIPGATSNSYTLTNVQMSDDGAKFRCLITNGVGSILSSEATLTVVNNTRPVVTFTTPTTGTLYRAGENINFSATATDAEDGTLSAAAFTWWIDFHHDTHTHPALATSTGISSGSYMVLRTNETSANVWYRIYVKVIDAGGLESTVIYRDVNPEVVDITLETSPTGIDLLLDGQTVQTPHTFSSVVGITRTIEAPSQTHIHPDDYYFHNWGTVSSDEEYVFNTPDVNTTYEAQFSTTIPSNIMNASYEEIKVYPSPTSDFLSLSFANNQQGKISILDLAGKTLYQVDLTNSNMIIPVSGLKKGMYLVRIETSDNTFIKTFLKE